MNGTDFLLWLQELRNGALDAFFALITFLGSEDFMLVLLAVVYWCVNRTLGLRLAMVMLASQYVNTTLKNLFPVARPGAPVVPLNAETTLNTTSWPSGHAQNTAAVGGLAALLVKRLWFTVVVVVLVFLVGFSRLYLGLHWPLDVISGWIIGVTIALVAVVIINAFPRLDARQVPSYWLGAVPVMAVLLVVVSPDANSAKACGAAMGLVLGWWLERHTVGFEAAGPLWQQAVKAVVGVAVAFGLRVALKPVLDLIPVAYVPDILRYSAIALWIAWVAPMLFVWAFSRRTKATETSATN